jgi:hypothetical protein
LQAKEYLDHNRGCIRIYTGAAQTLERRIAEANVGTSAKNDTISAEPKGVEIAETESEDSESEDSESDDAGRNSDVERY